jgi:NADH-quinone oxidoreductase subunit L
MHPFIPLFIAVQLLAFFATLFLQNKQERAITGIVSFTKAFYLLGTLAFAISWLANGYNPISYKMLSLYKTDGFEFALQFYYDITTAVFSIVGGILFFIVTSFSRFYMHRDEGFKRFFNTILLFATGYNIIIFAGNFETLFIGWEIIGLSSFLLIAFYRNRYLPVKNAFKVLSIYRLSDIALILAMWMMHHLTHQNISFQQLAEAKTMAALFDHEGLALLIAAMLLLAATAKSAQLPFTTWLPRAMEGPTSSSAIFYGSLSVHIGVFLLMRTYPFWQDMTGIKVAIIVIGAATAVTASIIARVQPTVKTQIAYASAAQIGLIFIEVALGFHILALVHFAGNAFLRTYQLLVSPSVLNYLIHHQYFHYKPREPKQHGWEKIMNGMYVLGLKEFNLDRLLYQFAWMPFKWLGRQLGFLQSKTGFVISALLLAGAVIALFFKETFSDLNRDILSIAAAVMALLLILQAFASRSSALAAWAGLIAAHGFIITGVLFTWDTADPTQVWMYASGIIATGLLGLLALQKIRAVDSDIRLHTYHGHVYDHKFTALGFLVAAIGLLGFPVTAAFIGIDVLFTYIDTSQVVLITLVAICFLFIELAAIRIYCRLFLGPHKNPSHPVAFRTS